MLVLTRHLNESIRIGDGVRIKILSIESNNVKIGVEAPKNIMVFREEIYDRIKEENINASNVDIHVVKSFAKQIKEQISSESSEKSNSAIIFHSELEVDQTVLDVLDDLKIEYQKYDNINSFRNIVQQKNPDFLVFNSQYFIKSKKFLEGFFGLRIIKEIPIIILLEDQNIDETFELNSDRFYVIKYPIDKIEFKRIVDAILKLKVKND